MKNNTCSECDKPSFARGYCRPHYMRAYRSGDLLPMEVPTHHRLTQIDREAKTAICSICGPTRVWVRSTSKGSMCMNRKRQSATARREANPDRARQQNRQASLRRRYGLRLEQVIAMAEVQGGACAICGTIPDDGLCVDHDHDTGAVRALLCRGCNTGIGMLLESPRNLLAAAAYIESHRL